MGLFGRQTRSDTEVETMAADAQEEYDEIPSLPTPLSSTVIATGLTLSGTMKGEGVIQVEGTVEGEIDLKGAVIVTSTGLIKGPVTADVVRVAGCIEGTVMARDHICLEKTGSLEGDVTTQSLVVEDGGRLNGRSSMLKQERPVPANNVNYGAGRSSEEQETSGEDN